MFYFLQLVRWVENIIAGSALLIIAGSTFIGVIFRYVINQPLIWTQELSLICFIWMIFVGSSIVLREKNHIQLDLVSLIPNARVKKVIEIIGFLAVFFILFIFIVYGFKQVAFATDKTTALQLPWKYVFLAIPVGSILMTIRMIQRLLHIVRAKPVEEGGQMP